MGGEGLWEITVMSSHVGFSCAKGPSRSEGGAEENVNRKTCSPCLKAVRQRLRSDDAEGEGRSGGAEHLDRPTLSGWRSHRMSHNRGRWRDEDRDTDEEWLSAEQTAGTERVKQRLRKTERPGDGGPARYGREAGGGSSASSAASNTQPTWPAAASASSTAAHLLSTPTRPSAPPPPRLPSRMSCDDLHRCPGASAREQDPFWAEVRATLAAGASTSRSQMLVPSGSELGEEEEEEEVEGREEGVSGAAVVMSQSLTSATAAQACVLHEEERKAGRRERNRIKYLRRRQRRRERWRLQESRQVSTGETKQRFGSDTCSSEGV